jgi:hypothetical protein
MNNLELYTKLAERYDKGQLVGAPMTRTLLKIFMHLFNPEEAEVALTLPFEKNLSLTEVKTLYPDKVDRIEEILDGMAIKGTVYRDIRPGKEKKYRLLPSPGRVAGNTILARPGNRAGQSTESALQGVPQGGLCRGNGQRRTPDAGDSR